METITPEWQVTITKTTEAEYQKVADFIDHYPMPPDSPVLTMITAVDADGTNLLLVHKTSRLCLLNFIFPTLTEDEVWAKVCSKVKSRVN